MAKVFLGVGHGGSDPGAIGYVVEKDVNLKMALACMEYLANNGVQVKMSRYKDENDSLNEEIMECNEYDADLAVDIHNNAGGGDGFEVYYSINGGTGKVLAENIEAEVKAIGQNSRGCKTKKNSSGKNYYGFIRETECPAVICEGAFVDNAEDAKAIDTDAGCKAFGEAYARGILKTLGIEPKKETVSKPTSSNETVKVELDVLSKGNKGEQVGVLQTLLVYKGYDIGNYGVDKSFGNDTYKAVLKLQKNNGLPETGIVELSTWSALLL